MKDKKAIIEAALFISPNPLSTNTLSKISGITSESVLKNILEEIKQDLDTSQRGIELAITAGGYHLRVRDHLMEKVSHLTPHSDLTDGMLRTLGLVALRQPIAQSQIIKIQGNKAYDYIKKMEKKRLIVGEKAGRTRVLRTTKEFETYFGRSLKDIQDSLKSVVENAPNKQPGIEVFSEEDKAGAS